MQGPIVKVREAGPDDVDAIAGIHHESYLSSAAGLLSAATLAMRTVQYRRVYWRDRLGTGTGSEVTLVAEDSSGLLGFINVSASSSDPHVGEVNKLFVATQHNKRGVGRTLLRAGTDRPA